MAEPLAMEATYLKKADFDAAMERIMSEFTSHVDQAIQKALEQNNAKLEEKIAAAKGEIRGELNAKLDQHIQLEREQRQAEIAAVQGQIKRVGDETSEKLGQFNQVIDEAKRGVESLNQDIRTWTNSLDANQKLYENQSRNIEKQDTKLSKLEDDVDSLEEAQVGTAENLKNIKHAIYGGNGDGPKSLYSLIEEMTRKMELGFSGQQTQLTAALELARSTATRQDQYEKDLQERKERWSKRRGMALDAAKKLITTPKGLVILGLILTSIVAIFRPEALPTLIQFFNQIFSANP